MARCASYRQREKRTFEDFFLCHLSNIDKGRAAFPRGKSLAKGDSQRNKQERHHFLKNYTLKYMRVFRGRARRRQSEYTRYELLAFTIARTHENARAYSSRTRLI